MWVSRVSPKGSEIWFNLVKRLLRLYKPELPCGGEGQGRPLLIHGIAANMSRTEVLKPTKGGR